MEKRRNDRGPQRGGVRRSAGPRDSARMGPRGGFGDQRPQRPPPPRRRSERGQWLSRGVPIIHEDKDVLVVEKPAGLLTANLPGETRDALFDMVKEYAKAKSRRAKAWIIHRLDKEASGLLVFAKNEDAYTSLKDQFRKKTVHRIYMAVLEGEVAGEGGAATPRNGEPAHELGSRAAAATRQLPQGTIQSFIREGDLKVTSVGLGDLAKESARFTTRPWRGERPPPGRGKRERTDQYEAEERDPNAPRLAVTHWRVVGRGQGRTLMQLRLETGRKNQIRVHMQGFGHPIVGDRRYGAASDPLDRVCLHATELGFAHPGTGETVRFSSPAPTSFYKLIGERPPTSSARRPDAEQEQTPAAETSWDSVAEWYDGMIEEERSDHFRDVIVPGALRLLGLGPAAADAGPESRPTGVRVLDVACGQGSLAQRIAAEGAEVVGIDASPKLIEAARARGGDAPLRFEVADARALSGMRESLGEFDAVISSMALMNIDSLADVFRGCAELLRPGGALVGIILHPAFRSPRQTSWGWSGKHHGARQFRRVDAYLSERSTPITMNPGHAAHGAEPVTTTTFHRPLRAYIGALAESGFVVEALEEWASQRQSQPGPRAAEENRARAEIPMFLAFRAVKR
jgi:23S rRNA-/tRNA-specific pseudouridylate synthase/SAM-dependent methyltransferase